MSNRAAILNTLHKVLAKHYKPRPATERPLLELLLYACFLEDSRPEVADECFARLQESFFDWNEVRVTTVRELSEIVRGLTDPMRASTQLKQTLHSVFEAIYNYDLEPLRKQGLGATVAQLQQLRGASRFMVAYVVQHGLGGHQIPVSRGALDLLVGLNAITEQEAQSGTVPGLERAIPKSKGPEFASLLQQFAADFVTSPNGQTFKSLLSEIDPEAKNRIAKRAAKKAEAPPAPEPVKASAAKAAPEKPTKAGDKTKDDKTKDDKGASDHAKDEKGKSKDKGKSEATKPASDPPLKVKTEKDASKDKDADKASPKPTATDLKVREKERTTENKGAKPAAAVENVTKAPQKDKKPSSGKDKVEPPKAKEKEKEKEKPKTKESASQPAAKPVKKAAKKSAPTEMANKKKPTKGADANKKPPKSIAKKASPTAKKSTSKQLARRKPR